MTETSINYAKALYELSVPEEAVLETEKIFRSTPQLKGALENPLVSLKEKEQTFLFAHEVCHIAFNHIYRSEGKNQKLWNIATDGVINSLLSQKDGLPIIEGGVNIEDAFKYDAEELYEKLLEEQEKNNSSNNNESSQSDDSENLENENTHDVGHDTHSMWSEAIKKKKEKSENANSENIDNKKTEQKDDDKIQEEKEKMAKIGEKKIFEENKVMRDKQLDKLRKSLAEQSTKYGVSTNSVNRHIDQIGSSKPLIDWTRLLKEAIKHPCQSAIGSSQRHPIFAEPHYNNPHYPSFQNAPNNKSCRFVNS